MSIAVAMVEPVGGHGGMRFYDVALCQGIVQAGGQATLFTSDATVVQGDEGFPVKHAYRGIWGQGRAWLRGLRFVRGSLLALPAARWRGHRVAHFHFFHVGPLEFFNVVLARLVGLRVVVTAHDVQAFKAGLSVPMLEDWAYRLAHRVITHSHNAQLELTQERQLPAAKLDLILHGNYLGDIPAHVTRSVARAHFGFSAEQRVLLFFGQIKDVKGLDVLLDAFALARARDERLHLVIAGRPWKCEFAPFQALIDRHGLAAHCSLHIRYIPDAEVALFYRSADLVVLPYRRIYQSGVVLQAMSHGTPVMVSDIAGLLEAVDDDRTGFVFKSQDPQSLADRIGDVFAVPGRAADVGAAGLRQVTEHNDWRLLGAQTLDCYQRAIGADQ